MGLLTDRLIEAARPLASAMAELIEERHHRELSSLVLGAHTPGAEYEAVAIYLRPAGTLRAWRYPDDPYIPALALAAGGATFLRATRIVQGLERGVHAT